MTSLGTLSNELPPSSVPKIRLLGRVADTDACELLTDETEVVVGSALECDLVVADPLAPRRAFRLRHIKEHAGHHDDCRTCWQLEAYPGSRVYVNGRLARHELISFGDSIALGCHRFIFDTGEGARDLRANVDIKDLCAALIRGQSVPPAYLLGCPSWRDWHRTRRAGMLGMTALLLCICAFLLFRPEEYMESALPPTEVVIVPQDALAATPTAVRSLEQVTRKNFVSVDAPLNPAELAALRPVTSKSMSQQPVIRESLAMARPEPLKNDRVAEDAGPLLPPLVTGAADQSPVRLEPERGKLARSAPVARRAIAQAEHALAAPELGQAVAQADKGALAARTFTRYSARATEARTAPKADLSESRKEVLAGLNYKPSPVQFEQYRGTRIPIARVPEQLASLPAVQGRAGFQLDGEVSDAEVAASFKTGRFRIHGPGNPPEADPATYCHVHKTQQDGKDHLYIGFICIDPNLSALVLKENSGTTALAWDDSIEIFLDINGDRNDYHHILVNARGNYNAAYCPDGDAGINGKGTTWDAGLKIKTTINQQAGRWICEVLIPYDRLPQQPSKGAEIPFNVCRNFRGQRGNQPLQNWFAVYEGPMTNYHHPRLFGKLVWP